VKPQEKDNTMVNKISIVALVLGSLCVIVAPAEVVAEDAPQLEWVSQFSSAPVGSGSSDTAYAISVGTSKNVYVAGTTSGVFSGEESTGGDDAFVSKFNAGGSLQWTDQFGTAGSDIAYRVSVDASGNVYVVGTTSGVFSDQSVVDDGLCLDAFVRKYNSDGTVAWTRQFGTMGDDGAYGVSADATGVYVAGYTYGTLSHDQYSDDEDGDTTYHYDDAFVRKYNSDGTVAWTHQFGTGVSDGAYAIAASVEDGQTYLYVAGYTSGTLILSSYGSLDAFVSKFSADGSMQWTDQFGTNRTDSPNAIATSVEGSITYIYVAGRTLGNLGGTANGADVFVRKYDSTSSVVWTRQFGFSVDDTTAGVSVSDTGVYVAGRTLVMPTGHYDAFVRKCDTADGAEVWTDQFGTTGDDGAHGVSADTTGVYFAGYTRGTLPGQLTRLGDSDAFAAKIAAETKSIDELLTHLQDEIIYRHQIGQIDGPGNSGEAHQNSLLAKVDAAVAAWNAGDPTGMLNTLDELVTVIRSRGSRNYLSDEARNALIAIVELIRAGLL